MLDQENNKNIRQTDEQNITLLAWVLPLSLLFVIAVIWYVIYRRRVGHATSQIPEIPAIPASTTGSELSPVYPISSDAPPTPMPSNTSPPKVTGGWFDVFSIMFKLK